MGNKVYPLGILCALIILSGFISSTQSASCCLKYIRHKIPCERIVGYTIQNIYGRCDLDAIIFHIKGDRFRCANPSLSWTKDRMECIK
uniref:C-C motif chemokine n=1 Tax=Gouania willdenowi TaxID=441366 RepID=A0A8C5GLQ4_GOUWI